VKRGSLLAAHGRNLRGVRRVCDAETAARNALNSNMLRHHHVYGEKRIIKLGVTGLKEPVRSWRPSINTAQFATIRDNPAAKS
jgi:hypothetical protein